MDGREAKDTDDTGEETSVNPDGKKSVSNKKPCVSDVLNVHHDVADDADADSWDSGPGWSKASCQVRRSLQMGPLITERRFYTQDQLNDTHPNLQETATLLHLLKQQCRCSGSCVVNALLRFLPIINVLRHYSWGSFFSLDLLSGISVGFLHLPQGLGFGLLADLRPVNGLYTSFFPVLVYMLFGTSPHVSMGTNAVVAMLSASIIDMEAIKFENNQRKENHTVSQEQLMDYKVKVSTAAAMLEGIILIAMGLLRMGFLTNYMSNSFIGGFSFAAAVHITISQIVKLFNLDVPLRSGFGKLIFTTLDIFQRISDTNFGDVTVGLICGIILLGISFGNKRYKRRLKVPIPGELIVVILSTLVSHVADLQERFNITVVGRVPQGMPAPSMPPVEIMSDIVPLAFVDAILIFVLTITLAKLTAKLHVISIDDNQELIAYGLCQVVGSFFQNFSSSISPPRTMMLSSMKSKSTLNGLSTAVFLLLVLVVAGQLFQSLPIAMLSIMIIVAMKDLLLQVFKVKDMWYVNKGDFIIWILTVLLGVLGDLDVGLVAGTLTSMVMVLAYSQLAKGTLLGKARCEDLYLDMDRQGIHPIPGVSIFRFESQLHFASAERFKSELYSKIFDPTSVAHKDHYEITVAVDDQYEPQQVCNSPELEGPYKGRSCLPCLRSLQCMSPFRRQAHRTVTEGQPAKGRSPTRILSSKAQATFAGLSEQTYTFTVPSDVSNNAAKTTPVERPSDEEELVRYVILDCSTMTYIDLTGVEMLHLIITQFTRAGVAMLLTDIPPTTLAILQRANFFEHENYSNVYFNVLDAIHDIRTIHAREGVAGSSA